MMALSSAILIITNNFFPVAFIIMVLFYLGIGVIFWKLRIDLEKPIVELQFLIGTGVLHHELVDLISLDLRTIKLQEMGTLVLGVSELVPLVSKVVLDYP